MLLLAAASLLATVTRSERVSAVTVETGRGTVTGFHEDLGSDRKQLFHGSADVFLGIPYAEPPVGDLVFKLPRKACKYDTPINATAYRDQCHQNVKWRHASEPPLHTSFDCLYLDVITPSTRGKYPVMVWFHGGAMVFGSSDIYDYKGAIRNLVSRDVIIVTIQYRLGFYGFFTTFTDDFPPNRALYDQVRALEWIHEEIAHFGGDPSRVTIFGESAGAVAVSALSMSPLSQGFFHRVIQMSGSATMEYGSPQDAFFDPSQVRAEKICGTTRLQWKAGDIQALRECLAKKNPQDIVQYETEVLWLMHMDGFFLPRTPSELARARPNYPILMGEDTDEFALFLGSIFPSFESYNRSSVSLLLNLLYPYFGEKIPLISEMIINTFARYPIKNEDHMAWLRLVNEAFSNVYFSSHLRRDGQFYLDNGNKEVFVYNFNYTDRIFRPLDIYGFTPVPHSSELSYLWFYAYDWENPALAGNITDEHRAVADFLGTTWTNFAKGSKGESPYEGFSPVSSPDRFEYYSFDLPQGKMLNKFRAEGDVLFNKVIPLLVGGIPQETVEAEKRKSIEEYGKRLEAEFRKDYCAPDAKDTKDTTGTKDTKTPTTTAPNDHPKAEYCIRDEHDDSL